MKTNFIRIAFFVFFIAFFVKSQQKELWLKSGGKIKKILSTDTLLFQNEMERLKIQKIAEGYISFHWKCQEVDSFKQICEADHGKKFKHVFITIDEDGHPVYISDRYQPASIGRLMELLNFFTKDGYTFVQFITDTLSVSSDSIFIRLTLRKGPRIWVDSVVYKGNVSMNSKVFSSLTGISSGQVFDATRLEGALKNIQRSGFMTTVGNPILRYGSGKMKIIFLINRLNASHFDGIMGLQPDPLTGKSVLTGQVTLALKNAILNHAEDFGLEWRRIKQSSQELKMNARIPYLFGTPMGIDGKFSLFRQDSTLLDVMWEGGVNLFFSGLNSIRLYSSRKSNRSTGIYTGSNQNGESKILSGGLGLILQNTDFPMNPTRGFHSEIQTGTGKRILKQNHLFSTEAIEKSTRYYDTKGFFMGYIPFFKRSCIVTGLRGSAAWSDLPLLASEMYRVGGLQTWRGFDENNFFSSAYAITTLEYRFIFGRLSYFSVFSDGGWYERLSSDTYEKNFAFGYGTGLQLGTKGGLLKLAYAFGHLRGTSPDLRNGKIHVGFISLFR